MAKKKLTEEQIKEIKLLQANNEMLENTKEEAKIRGKGKEVIERIEIAQQDVLTKLSNYGEDVKQVKENDFTNKSSYDIVDDGKTIFEVLDGINESKVDNNDESNVSNVVSSGNIIDTIVQDTDFSNIDSDAQYDVISLPSNGECYRSKMSRIPVGYLTAYDENFITSPNLYKDGLIIDFLLKNKIMNKNINIDELVSGDVDAIILFLRATSYGPEFPIVVKDPDSGVQFDSVVDLMTLKSKEFKLVGDENGHFDFELPVSKDSVKFKFLTRSDEKKLKILASLESDGVKANTIVNNLSVVIDGIKDDKTLNGKDKQEHIKAINKINEWAKGLLTKNGAPYSKTITNRLEMSIVAINGNYDRKYISKYVKNMAAKDSLMLRRYILENEPGIDFEIEVERPESLGGGSFKTFLQWDDSVFLNIS